MNLFFANLKLLFRNRQLLFWSMAFPLIFILIFGLFFGNDIGLGKIVLVNNSQSQIAASIEEELKKSDLFEVVEKDNVSQAKELLKDDQANTAVEIPSSFDSGNSDSSTFVKIIYDPDSQQSGSIVTSIVSRYLTEVNFQVQGAKEIFSVKQEQSSERQFTYFDFVLIGLIGLALMNSNIQGLAISMAKYREDKIFKRIITTPLPTWKFIVAEVAARLVMNVVQIALIILVGLYAFKGSITGSLPILISLSLLGAILFQLIGFVVASSTRTTSAAEGMSTAITIPMMFLSGVFFPIDQLPGWMFSIVQYLPLSPLLQMMRKGALENISPLDSPISLVIVIVWIFAALLFATWRFRLSEE